MYTIKNQLLKGIAALLIGALFPLSLIAQAKMVIRIVQTEDKPDSPVLERMIQSVLKEIDKSARIDILPALSADGAATHLAEVSSTFAVTTNSLVAKSFNDSTGKISFRWDYAVKGTVDLLITEVQTGRISSFRSIAGNGSSAEAYELSYKDAGWAKGKNSQDEKEQQQLVSRARNLLQNKASNLYNQGINTLIADLVNRAQAAPNLIFPYRLKVVEATEIKKNDAEKVRIEGGQAFDLRKGDRMVVYTTSKIQLGGREYEHFEIIGRLKYESDLENGGLCGVSKGEEKILAALQAGQPVWCRAGQNPYVVNSKAEEIKIAIGSLITPKDAPADLNEKIYRRLRVQILGRKGCSTLEREKLKGIQKERDLQKQETFIDNAAIEQFKSVGADLLVEIKFLDPVIDVEREYMTNKVLRASVTAVYAMRLLDVATGEVLNERNGRSTKYFDQEEATPIANAQNSSKGLSLERIFYHQALGKMWFEVVNLINEVFPPKIMVAEITDEKKDKADELLLVGELAMKSNDKYFVMRKKMVNVDGQELARFEQLGIVSLRDAEGEGIVNAKVKEGGREIYAAMKAGDELFCVDKPNLLERMGKWGNNRMERYGY